MRASAASLRRHELAVDHDVEPRQLGTVHRQPPERDAGGVIPDRQRHADPCAVVPGLQHVDVAGAA